MMSLSDLAALGNLVGGVAVLVSLAYLSVQVRQNTKHMRALMFQGRAARINDHLTAMLQPDACAAYIAGNDQTPTPDAIRRRQFYLQCSGYFVGWEDSYLQHREGLMGAEEFARFRDGLAAILARDPGLRRFVSRMTNIVQTNDFREFLQNLLPEAGREGSPGLAAEAHSDTD
jgi:hypothetical protein